MPALHDFATSGTSDPCYMCTFNASRGMELGLLDVINGDYVPGQMPDGNPAPNPNPIPTPEVVLGDPDQQIIFGDPGTGVMFGR